MINPKVLDFPPFCGFLTIEGTHRTESHVLVNGILREALVGTIKQCRPGSGYVVVISTSWHVALESKALVSVRKVEPWWSLPPCKTSVIRTLKRAAVGVVVDDRAGYDMRPLPRRVVWATP